MTHPRDKSRVFMDAAKVLATLGTCDRKRVGAVIIREGRCISWGYNGAPPGLPHCDENGHGWTGRPGLVSRDPSQQWLEEKGCRNATHAEANALAAAARQGISTDGAELFVTVSPCATCSRLLVAAGISKVWYNELYRDAQPLDLLAKAGVEIDSI